MMQDETVSILGCGWLGHPLGAALVEDGYRVKGSTTTPEKQEALRADGIEPYLIRLDPDLSGEPGDFFDADILFLNIPPPRRRDDAEAYHLQQIDAVIDAATRGSIGWVIFASSTGVYPKVHRVVTEEDAPDDPDAVEAPMRSTGSVLLKAERRLQSAGGFDTTVLRFAGLYGGDRQPGRFMAGRTDVRGGDAPINLIHRDDCIGIVQAVLEQDARGDVFNACSDAHPTRREFYPEAARQLGLEPPTFSDDGGTNKIVSNAKLKRVLGYTFEHPDPLGA